MQTRFQPKVLTANDLVAGRRVYLTAEGWAPRPAEAMVAVSREQAEELEALGQRFVVSDRITMPALVEMGA